MRTRFLLCILPVVLLTACGKNSDVQVGDSGTGQQVVMNTYMPSGDVKDPVHGKEVYLSYGAMTGIGETKANGVSTMHIFEDGSTNIGTQMNIEQAPSGSYYELWAAKPGSSAATWVSLGQMTSVLGDVRHAHVSSQKDDLRAYSDIELTLESNDGNPAASAAIAVGHLKQAKR